jgi:hypothetical protein
VRSFPNRFVFSLGSRSARVRTWLIVGTLAGQTKQNCENPIFGVSCLVFLSFLEDSVLVEHDKLENSEYMRVNL